ncbi:MAG: hypothetical protein MJE77_15380 [Proteobacteria bacterium]|nr:hypothetical protein [Pseudomonadota bacterium]
MAVDPRLGTLAAELDRAYRAGELSWALGAGKTPQLEPFLSQVGPHIGSFVQVQWSIPAGPIAVVTGNHTAAYYQAYRALARASSAPAPVDRIAGRPAGRPIDAWIDAVANTGARQWGLKWSVDPDAALQLYMRGRFGLNVVTELATLVVDDQTVQTDNTVSPGSRDIRDQTHNVAGHLLAYCGKSDFRLLGVEIAPAASTAPSRQIAYVTLASAPATAERVRRAIADVIAWRLAGTRWPHAWPSIAGRVVSDRGAQTVFLSTECARPGPAALKIDVGSMHVTEVAGLATALGISAPDRQASLAELLRFGVKRTEQTGIRLLPDGTASVSLYVRAWRIPR